VKIVSEKIAMDVLQLKFVSRFRINRSNIVFVLSVVCARVHYFCAGAKRFLQTCGMRRVRIERFFPMTGRIRLAALALAAFVLGAPPAAAVTDIDGIYLDPGGYVQITLRPCGNARCGVITRIVRAKPGEPDHDVHNDNPALRNRPILGLTILSGLRWQRGAWRGQVYNPEDGGTYRAVVNPGSGGSLRVQGCLAIICRTQSWPSVR
jgi:uncharacterized protein (DUF2147 family)